MTTNYGSTYANGILFPAPTAQSYDPLTMGAEYSGPAFYPRGGQYLTPPIMPSPAASFGADTYSPDYTGSDVTLPTAGAVSKNGGMNYFHLKKSPLVWVVVLLVFALVMLHKVHFR